MTHYQLVALRKESVDRNEQSEVPDTISQLSLSARRAWIEMPWGGWGARPPRVALRKESVDRNCLFPPSWSLSLCRSPQGERG